MINKCLKVCKTFCVFAVKVAAQKSVALELFCFLTQDLLPAMKSLGLSPSEQEVVDMQCEVEKKGRIFFPDFCKLCLRKFREFDEENFRQIMFKV